MSLMETKSNLAKLTTPPVGSSFQVPRERLELPGQSGTSVVQTANLQELGHMTSRKTCRKQHSSGQNT